MNERIAQLDVQIPDVIKNILLLLSHKWTRKVFRNTNEKENYDEFRSEGSVMEYDPNGYMRGVGPNLKREDIWAAFPGETVIWALRHYRLAFKSWAKHKQVASSTISQTESLMHTQVNSSPFFEKYTVTNDIHAVGLFFSCFLEFILYGTHAEY